MLDVGTPADLVIFDDDPLAAATALWASTRTVVRDGKVVA